MVTCQLTDLLLISPLKLSDSDSCFVTSRPRLEKRLMVLLLLNVKSHRTFLAQEFSGKFLTTLFRGERILPLIAPVHIFALILLKCMVGLQ